MNDSPNILFIFSDQQHYRAAGFLDPFFDTPSLDRLSRESAVFTHSFCTTPQCSPSRSTLLTGFYPHQTGVWGNVGAAGGEPLRQETIGPVLQRGGYYTGYFGKWHLGADVQGTAGWDEEDGVNGAQPADSRITRHAQTFLERRYREGEKQKPWALFLSYDDPHGIYGFKNAGTPLIEDAPLPQSFDKETFEEKPPIHMQFMDEDQGKVMKSAETRDWRKYRSVYRERVSRFDREIGRVIERLEELGLAENTVIVITSDHGDMDTHHRLIYKGPFMYEQMIRVPLLIKTPGRCNGNAAQKYDELIVNADLFPTLLDYAGLLESYRADSKAGTYALPGRSLRPLLSGKPFKQREFIISEYYSKQKWVNPIRTIRTQEWKYNLYAHYGAELYDMQADPHEIHNRAEIKEYKKISAELQGRLTEWIHKTEDPFFELKPTDREGNPVSGGK
jgi:arylsulfatase A-like enzyme